MPKKAIKIGLLDFLSVDDSSYARSLSEVVECAQLADSLHFSRFWLAEHHVWCGSGSPEMLLPLMAATTSQIKVGMAGVLLNFYSPYKVAETFQVLEELFPGRIDLGVCRGACDPVIAKALIEGRELDHSILKFEEKTTALLGYLQDGIELGRSVKLPRAPSAWLLGTGEASMLLASRLGTSYCHSLFHSGALQDPKILHTFRDLADNGRTAPQCALAIAGVCAEHAADVPRLLAAHSNEYVLPTVIGTAAQCQDKILTLTEVHGVDEIIWLDLSTTRSEQKGSLSRLAAQMGLSG
ncbi:LLM class flavin-dependent oxidoreductase [Janthinobacterium psychrotolerans]|uniref:Luciferase family oxidoreductase, group 1 n=1 Tax=Janthinobacterium psychrotolerans TaxID=1747903 RepID=A0A1A7BY15_9BURK|nr:LLM class flavin-dependent oxidoreductase [Janthinobacterium psychrotolerans]OBV38407.1 luciferase family oxidoreductase, group 1 [Janthinobacterium psychrotolerans]